MEGDHRWRDHGAGAAAGDRGDASRNRVAAIARLEMLVDDTVEIVRGDLVIDERRELIAHFVVARIVDDVEQVGGPQPGAGAGAQGRERVRTRQPEHRCGLAW